MVAKTKLRADHMSTGEAGAALGVSSETVRRLIHAGELAAVRVGPKLLKVTVAGLERYVEANVKTIASKN